MARRLTREDIQKALDECNDLRDKGFVTLVNPEDYINQRTKLLFECSEGHEWITGVGNVLNACTGCPTCALNEKSVKLRRDIADVREQLFSKGFSDINLPYLNEEYSNNKSKLTCMCETHGEYKKTLSQLLVDDGRCPKCVRDEILRQHENEFFEKCILVHGERYDYTQTVYKGRKSRIKITCSEHGTFKQLPGDHINGHGCPSCVKVAASNKALTWLETIIEKEDIFIEHAANVGEFQIVGTNYRVDGYHRDSKTCYEFHGDAFHGNPSRYTPDDKCHPFSQETASELYEKTIRREQEIRALGYNLVVIWESEWDQLKIPTRTFDRVQRRRTSLPDDIERYGIELMDEEFINFSYLHTFKCLKCNENYQTTLSRRKQLFKNYGTIGCPPCNKE